MTHGPSEIFLSAVLVCAVYSQTSPEKEIALGQHMAAEIESNHRAIADAEVIGYVDSVLNNLSRNESLRLPLKVRVIDNSDLIAALPGGFLILSSGAILRAESEAELAGLLAHAMGHVQTGQFQRTTRSPGVQVPLIFFGCLRSNAEIALVPRGNVAEFDLFESQADLLGLGYMLNAGYDPQALVTVFERSVGAYRPDDEVKSKARALANASSSAIWNTSTFDQIKARLAPPRRVPTLYR